MICQYEHGGTEQSTVMLASGEMTLSEGCAGDGTKLPSLDTFWTRTPKLKGATGVSVSSSEGKGAFSVYGFVMSGDAASPTCVALKFTDSGGVNSGDTIFAGVPTGQQDI